LEAIRLISHRTWCVLAIGLLTAALLGCEKRDTARVLKLAHSLDTEHPVHKAMAHMADLVAKRSGGTLRVEIFPSGQLGSERECIELVQLGILDMTKTSSGPMEGFVPDIKVYGLPYLFRDEEHMWKVFKGPIGRELLLAGQNRGLRGLCYYDAGARSFYTVSKPIHTPADLHGMKIRVQQSEMSFGMVRALGASPTPIDWGELYTALQQGVVDGAENNPPSFYLSNHYEICKYYTLDEHLRVPDVLVMSTETWNSLTADQQRILQEAVDESVDYQRQLWKEEVDRSLAAVAKAGVEIIHPDKEPFREAVQSFWHEFDGTRIGELAKEIQQVH
jgi:tripartite ATP-independent transporter DctP family solute receptor